VAEKGAESGVSSQLRGQKESERNREACGMAGSESGVSSQLRGQKESERNETEKRVGWREKSLTPLS
jgi:hypothetical protein